jgi:hypothetical protein
MVAIYSTKDGHTITAGLQSDLVCSQAKQVARAVAREKNTTVILDDPECGGEYLVGPRGRIRKFTPALKRKMGF